MSRALNDIKMAYINMDIENLPDETVKEESNSLVRKPKKSTPSGMDESNPVYRVGKQMKIIRKYRDDLKNGIA